MFLLNRFLPLDKSFNVFPSRMLGIFPTLHFHASQTIKLFRLSNLDYQFRLFRLSNYLDDQISQTIY